MTSSPNTLSPIASRKSEMMHGIVMEEWFQQENLMEFLTRFQQKGCQSLIDVRYQVDIERHCAQALIDEGFSPLRVYRFLDEVTKVRWWLTRN